MTEGSDMFLPTCLTLLDTSSHQCFYLANNDAVYGRHVLSLSSSKTRKGLCITQIKNQYSSAQIATQ